MLTAGVITSSVGDVVTQGPEQGRFGQNAYGQNGQGRNGYGDATAPVPVHHPTQQVPAHPAPVPFDRPPVHGQVVPYQQPMTYQGPPVVAVVQAPGSKETLVAYLLWFFLGGVGADRFYLGRAGEGIGMLALWLVGWATVWFFVGWLFLVPLYVWALVNAFRIPGEVRGANTRAVAALYGYR